MCRKGGNIRVRFRNFTPSLAFIKEIIGGGTPSLARQGLASVATILLNVAAGAYGDAAIAGMSIVTRIAMFINAFLIGFGQGFQPVCGFNYGAGLYARVRQGFWFCVKVGFIFLLVCALAGMGFAEDIVSLFRKGDPDVIAVGAAALRWQFITFPLGSWIVMSNMMLQTIRKPVKATIISSARQGETTYLTDYRSQRGPRYPHIETKNQDRVQYHVNHRTRYDSYHRICCISLEANLIIQY